jgi:hypothetical protein
MSRGVQAMVCDSASLSVMMESIGHLNPRWMQTKREEFMALEESKRGAKLPPRCIKRQESRLQHAISSLSSSSDDLSNNNASSSEQETSPRAMKKAKVAHLPTEGTMIGPKNTTEKSFSGDQERAPRSPSVSDASNCSDKRDASKDFHDYNAKPLPDPKIGYPGRSSGSSLSDSIEESNGKDCKRSTSTDSSSGDDSAEAEPSAAKRRKVEDTNDNRSEGGKSATLSQIAKKGGISHNVRPVEPVGNGAARLGVVPAIVLPPFSGLGKRPAPSVAPASSVGLKIAAASGCPLSVKSDPESKRSTLVDSSNTMYPKGPTVIAPDLESSACSDDASPQIRANYHVNEDDRILMDDVLMCPFMFRSEDAVLCGAVSECVMPGMLRAQFSARNKLQSMELVYDAMGLMQQLARASCTEGTAQIVPGSVEMALTPSSTEARVITMAQPPYLIMNVNEVWTRTTGYTQMDVEGKEYLRLLEGEGTVPEAKERPGKPSHKLEEVAKGRPACSTNIHYDKDGRDFIEFVCSYPLTNESDEITHILHVSKELPSFRDCGFE